MEKEYKMSIRIRAIAFLLSFLLVAAVAVPFALACDTRTPGYWKNHYPGAWPASPEVTYSDPEVEPHTLYEWTLPGDTLEGALAILNTPVRGDVSINLKQKVIAAILSIADDPITGWSYAPNFAGGPMEGATLPELIDAAVVWLGANPSCLPGSNA